MRHQLAPAATRTNRHQPEPAPALAERSISRRGGSISQGRVNKPSFSTVWQPSPGTIINRSGVFSFELRVRLARPAQPARLLDKFVLVWNRLEKQNRRKLGHN